MTRPTHPLEDAFKSHMVDDLGLDFEEDKELTDALRVTYMAAIIDVLHIIQFGTREGEHGYGIHELFAEADVALNFEENQTQIH